MPYRRYIAKSTGRAWNTVEEAKRDNSKYNNDIEYRYWIKSNNYDKNNPIKNYIIPYIKEKKITLKNAGLATGATFSENVLDSIYDNAKRAGLDFKTALGIAIKETTLNNDTYDLENYGSALVNYHDKSNPYYEAQVYARDKSNYDDAKYIQMLSNGERYADKKAVKLLEDVKPMSTLEAAFRKYKQNPKSYNPGQSNYVELVNKRANEAMNSPQIINFINKRNKK